MIIKEKSIKSYIALERVLRYVLSKEVSNGFVHTRFIREDRVYKKQIETYANDTEAISIIAERRLQNMLKTYKNNDVKRIHKREKETKFHHSILSFHKADHLSIEDLQKVVREFIKKRYPKSIVCAVSHHDKEHQHIHLIGSHVQFSTGITNYHTKEEFSQIKQQMELWQEQELALVHSKISHVKNVKKKTKNHFLKMWNIN